MFSSDGPGLWTNGYLNVIVQRPKIIDLDGCSFVDGPISINDVLVLVGTNWEGQGKFEINLTFLVDLLGEFLFILPFVPVADEFDFVDSSSVRRVPYEIDEVRGA